MLIRDFQLPYHRLANHRLANHRWVPNARLPLLAAALLILTAAGCQSTSLPRPSAPISTKPPASAQRDVNPDQLEQQAVKLQQQGRNAAAAKVFLQVAQLYAESENFAASQNALNSFIRLFDWSAVAQNIAQDPAQQNTSSQGPIVADRFDLPANHDQAAALARVRAALAIHQGNFGLAEQHLFNILPSFDDDPNATLRTGTRLCVAAQQWACAVSKLLQLPVTESLAESGPDQVLDQAPEQAPEQAHNNLVWHYINSASLSQIQQAAATSTSIERGWWELQLAAISGFASADQRRAIGAWQRAHGTHPAQYPWPTAIATALDPQWQPERVALLLPLSGQLAAVGQALRNGFISAYLHDEADYKIRIFDSSAAPISDVYGDIQNWQAQVIIGPLAKADLQNINALKPEIPVLGLNYLNPEIIAAPNLFQLGLAVEDEADTLVSRLLADGVKNILLLHSEADWSKRAAQRIIDTWPEAYTVETFEDVRTVTEAVGKGMFVDTSHLRSQQLYRLLQSHIEFLPRARTDLDAVVALMDNTQANALKPALKFHFGTNLPIYASSQAVRGVKAEKLTGLSGFRVSELPWNMFNEPLPTTVQDSFGLQGSSLSSLYALGADAYRVTDRLSSLLSSTDIGMLGNTGVLSMESNRRIHREQTWGVIASGALMALPIVTGSR